MKPRNLIPVLLIVFFISAALHSQDIEIYSARQSKLLEQIDNGLVILTSETSAKRLNKDFYYLTGIEEPGVTLVLSSESKAYFSTTGKLAGKSDTQNTSINNSSEFQQKIIRYLARSKNVYLSFKNIELIQNLGRSISSVESIKNIDPVIVSMRVIKDEAEIEILKRACLVTAQGLNDTYKAIEAGLAEKDLRTFMEYGYERRGSPGVSFLQAASGPNSTNIHFGAGERKLKDGDMIVFDVGAYWDKYTADISRSVPVSGKFTNEQKQIYQVVLNAQKAAIELMIPGQKIKHVQKVAEDVLVDGLFELGLILDKNSQWQRRFYIVHGFYHFIGLDVHDVWYDYKYDENTIYEPGMVMTMEPGLYFPEDKLDKGIGRMSRGVSEEELKAFIKRIRPVYEKYTNIGVRIEDDILVTRDGNLVLTSAVPKEIVDIEKMMKEKSPHNDFKY